ncbi:MAG: DUF5591 domain-containing protein [Candidatus Bathyarchaeia archaeon]
MTSYKPNSFRTTANPLLKFYNPTEVYSALTSNKNILGWLDFVANHYLPEPRKVLLLYPCSTVKPYHVSRSYKILFSTLSQLGEKRKNVHLVTISEPFGLVPEEFYGVKTEWHDWEKDWYDCPGLFRWWCSKHGQPYCRQHLDASIEILASNIASFLKRVKTKRIYSQIIAFVRTYSSNLSKKDDHTHRRIIERASQLSNVKVKLLPTKSQINQIVSKRGRLAWDLYGVAHPYAQSKLLTYLRRIL